MLLTRAMRHVAAVGIEKSCGSSRVAWHLYVQRGLSTHQPKTSTPDSTTVIQSDSDGNNGKLPDLPTRAPSLMEIRRSRQQAQLDVTPRKYQEPASDSARTWIYNAIAASIAAMIWVLFKLTLDDEAAAKHEMRVLTSEIRKLRASAKRALLSASGMNEEIPFHGTRMIKYYASGPVDAPLQVLLHAEDGETAALWGFVHDQLAKSNPSIRVVSFHKTGVLFDPQRSTTVPLRLREVELLVSHLKHSALVASTRDRGTSSWFMPSASRIEPKFLVVSHGEGAWGALSYAGLHQDSTIGAVCVSPMLMFRGRRTAWVDAVQAASRVTARTDPDALQRYLDPPALQIDANLAAMDAKRMQALGSNVLRVSQTMGNQATAVTEAERRLAEDMRKQRSKQPVLSELDMELVLGIAPRKGEGTPKITALCAAPDALPVFVRRDQLLATSVWMLQACNALGVAMLESADRLTLGSQRRLAAPDMATELTQGAFQPLPNDSNVAVGPEDLGSGLSKIDKLSSPMLFALGSDSAASEAINAGPQDQELKRIEQALKRLKSAFSFDKRLPVEKSFSFLYLQSEFSLFPSNFNVVLVDSQSPEVVDHEPRSTWLDSLAFGVHHTHPNLAVLPLQAPESVVAAVQAHIGHSPTGAGGGGGYNKWPARPLPVAS